MTAPSGELVTVCGTVLLALWILRKPIANALDVMAVPQELEQLEQRVSGVEDRWNAVSASLNATAETIGAEAERSRKDREAARMHLARITKLQQQREGERPAQQELELGQGDAGELDERWIAETMAQMGSRRIVS